MRRLDLQRHMLLDDLVDQPAELLQPVDVAGIHQHAVGQRARLVAVGLVRLVEKRPHLGVLGQHELVEMGGQRFATRLQQRDGGFDDGALFWGQHEFSNGGGRGFATCETRQPADKLLIQYSCQPGD